MLSIAHLDKVDNSDNESCDGDGPRHVNLPGHGHDHTDAHRKRQTIDASQSWERKREDEDRLSISNFERIPDVDTGSGANRKR